MVITSKKGMNSVKKYAVAIANLFENTNKIHIVVAQDSIIAIYNVTGDPVEI